MLPFQFGERLRWVLQRNEPPGDVQRLVQLHSHWLVDRGGDPVVVEEPANVLSTVLGRKQNETEGVSQSAQRGARV